MCPNIQVVNLTKWENIENRYEKCYKDGGIHILIEYPELYYIN
jgi:hypothetical protein